MAFTVLPFLGVLVGVYQLATQSVALSDWVSFGVMYCVAGFGITTGYHRLLSHRAFATPKWVRYAFAIAGSIAGQGPAMIWVAHHRRHHRHADKPGDPHSPYNVHDPAQGLTLTGFWNSHLSWLFNPALTSDPIRYCPDLARDRGIRFISNHFVFFVIFGVLLGGAIGGLIAADVRGFLNGMLWGGLIRIFVANNVTYAVNSFGHTVGARRFSTPEESRNVSWLAIPSFGEAWHNNHHAFPRSASHGLRWYEVDLSAALIWLLERFGLATSVIRVDRATQDRVAAIWADRGGGRASSYEPQLAPQRPLAALKHATAGPSATDVE